MKYEKETQKDLFLEKDQELKERYNRTQYMIGLFGGSSDKVSVDWAEKLAYELTKKYHRVITGGYKKGVMGSALEGANQANKELKENSVEKNYWGIVAPIPKGVVMEKFKPEMAKTGKYIKTEIVEDFFARKRGLITEPSAFIIFEGGMGTGAEITDALQYNLKLLKEKKPIIFTGTGNTRHEKLLEAYKEDIIEDETQNFVYFVNTPEEVMKVLEIFYQVENQPELVKEEDKKILEKYRLFKNK